MKRVVWKEKELDRIAKELRNGKAQIKRKVPVKDEILGIKKSSRMEKSFTYL